MTSLNPDILILGSGIGGSLLATILVRAGKSVVMIDRSRHPRFAIGESSTPLADQALAQIANRFGIPELKPLCHWGTWKRKYPGLLCGKKRGFTYFDLTRNENLTADNFDSRRLLVAASVDDEHSDTHWLRSDVDSFVFDLARSSGVSAFQQCRYELSQQNAQWILTGKSVEEVSEALQSIQVQAPFLIDATGSPNGVLKFLKVPDQTHLLKTHSRSTFAHFRHAKTCEQLLIDRAISIDRFPYRCDDAAVHHVLPDGWMWQLRYDDNSLSAGFMIDERPQALHVAQSLPSPADEWNWRIARSPFLARQFRTAQIVRPESGLQSTKRIQRLATQGAGHNWAAMSNTVGFIDPLHSTGIAHTLFGVSRLADILLAAMSADDREQRLQDYSDGVISELLSIDEFVEGCYEAIPSFRLWCLWGMLYFAAATSMEQSTELSARGFLQANNMHFRALMREARDRLGAVCRAGSADQSNTEDTFAQWLKSAIQPWNRVGLFDDGCNNLYSKTAAPIT